MPNLGRMFWVNYHSHSHYCDGIGTLDEQVAAAQQQGVHAFGFSSHSPVPFENAWSMRTTRLEHYLGETQQLKEKHTGSIELYTGLEVDFIPGCCGPSTYRNHLDYTIGSVHYVGLNAQKEPWEIDGSQAVFMDGLITVHLGDVETVVRTYYGLIRQMVQEDPPDIIGHIDKIKIQNPGSILFNEKEDWYRDECIQTLDLIATTSCMVEVNTRGLYKRSLTTYPGPEWLPLLRERNIPVVLSSDSHQPAEITAGFSQAATLLLQAGYKTTRILLNGRWQEARLTKAGLSL